MTKGNRFYIHCQFPIITNISCSSKYELNKGWMIGWPVHEQTCSACLETIDRIRIVLIYFSATKDFILEMSDAVDGPWTKIVEGQLTFPNPVFLLEKFPLNQPHSGRFIKFTAVNCHGYSCGLTFIEAVASENGPRLNDYRISTKGSFPSKI